MLQSTTVRVLTVPRRLYSWQQLQEVGAWHGEEAARATAVLRAMLQSCSYMWC